MICLGCSTCNTSCRWYCDSLLVFGAFLIVGAALAVVSLLILGSVLSLRAPFHSVEIVSSIRRCGTSIDADSHPGYPRTLDFCSWTTFPPLYLRDVGSSATLRGLLAATKMPSSWTLLSYRYGSRKTGHAFSSLANSHLYFIGTNKYTSINHLSETPFSSSFRGEATDKNPRNLFTSRYHDNSYFHCR
ncbi:hypothetical protein PUN28_014562 [Cardiocondyla obscurior]|uniref:Uncharacterized protein n=1 Tax=Cardiocondyla obscurior TaxID=286306 RepID=A0AAW2F5T8_9HYME